MNGMNRIDRVNCMNRGKSHAAWLLERGVFNDCQTFSSLLFPALLSEVRNIVQEESSGRKFSMGRNR